MRFPVVNLGESFVRQTQFALVDDTSGPPAPPPPPAPQQSAIPFSPESASQTMENPPAPTMPFPRFVTQEEAAKRKNITGLAVTGGIMAAAIAAGMIIFR